MSTVPPDAAEDECWLPVPGYLGLYEISDQGRVRSFPRMTAIGLRGGGILKPQPRGNADYGYLGVVLCNGETKWAVGVHQLVMLAFEGRSPEGLEILHGDGDPGNNRRTNLRYDTHAANQREMVDHGRAHGCGKIGSRHPKAKLTEELVVQIRQEYAAGRVTERDLASRHGVNVSTLHRLLIRQTWIHV